MDSAGGPIKRTKPNNAAVMLLRGKVLNVARTDFESVINNNELMMIAKGIGAELSNTGFSLLEKNLRFGKIIIAADSDEDGNHIQSLLMTFFYKYFPSLIKSGRLYILAPRLFSVKTKNGFEYFVNEKEMKEYIKENKIRSPEIHRYKGLGSFSDDQFASQIDPKTRTLIKVEIPNATRAKQALKLMEQDVEARKQLIGGEWEWEN